MLTKQEEEELMVRVQAYARAEIEVRMAAELKDGTLTPAVRIASSRYEDLITFIKRIGSGT